MRLADLKLELLKDGDRYLLQARHRNTEYVLGVFADRRTAIIVRRILRESMLIEADQRRLEQRLKELTPKRLLAAKVRGGVVKRVGGSFLRKLIVERLGGTPKLSKPSRRIDWTPEMDRIILEAVKAQDWTRAIKALGFGKNTIKARAVTLKLFQHGHGWRKDGSKGYVSRAGEFDMEDFEERA
jgi:hypothetical protein